MNGKGFGGLEPELRGNPRRRAGFAGRAMVLALVALLAVSSVTFGVAGAQSVEPKGDLEKTLQNLERKLDPPAPKASNPETNQSTSQNATTTSGSQQPAGSGDIGTDLGQLEKRVDDLGGQIDQKTEAVGDSVQNKLEELQRKLEGKTPTPTPPPPTATPPPPTATPSPPTATPPPTTPPSEGEGEGAPPEATPQAVVQEVAPAPEATPPAEATPTPVAEVAVVQPTSTPTPTPAPTVEVAPAPVAVLPITGGVDLDSLAIFLTILGGSGLLLRRLAQRWL